MLFRSVFLLAAHGLGVVLGGVAAVLSPYDGLLRVLNPLNVDRPGVLQVSAWPTVAGLLVLAAGLSQFTVVMLRRWNPSKEVYQGVVEAVATGVSEDSASEEARIPSTVVKGAQRKHRRVWDQPVIWREMRTRAYGRRMIWIKLCYVLLALVVGGLTNLALGWALGPGWGTSLGLMAALYGLFWGLAANQGGSSD